MKLHFTWRASPALALTTLALFVFTRHEASAAPNYTFGQTGTFGFLGQNRDFAFPDNLNIPGHIQSTRFTATQTVTVDRVLQRYDPWQAPDSPPGTLDYTANLTVGVQKDDGTGKPNGTYIAITPTVAMNTTGEQVLQFQSSVQLDQGEVYHILTQQTSYTGDTVNQWLSVASAMTNRQQRVGDRGIDPNTTVLRSTNSGSTWTPLNRDPFFVFANGADTAFITAFGQPNIFNYHAAQIYTYSTTERVGQTFGISDAEAPAGSTIEMKDVTIFVAAHSSPVPMIVRVRETDGTLIATATTPITAASAGAGTDITLTWDSTVLLQQGQTYLLTTELDGVPNGGWYTFRVAETGYAPYSPYDHSSVGWGGTNYLVVDGTTSAWTSYTPYLGVSFRDLEFTFQGEVLVPEPASLALLAAGLTLALARRRRTS